MSTTHATGDDPQRLAPFDRVPDISSFSLREPSPHHRTSQLAHSFSYLARVLRCSVEPTADLARPWLTTTQAIFTARNDCGRSSRLGPPKRPYSHRHFRMVRS